MPKLASTLSFVTFRVNELTLSLELLAVGAAVGLIASWFSVGRYLRADGPCSPAAPSSSARSRRLRGARDRRGARAERRISKSHIDDKIQAQKAHIHAVNAKLHQKKAQLDAAQAKVGTIAVRSSPTPTATSATVNGRLGAIQGRIASTQRKLDWNRIQLAAAKATLKRHQDALARRLVDAYEHGDLGYVDVLLRARSFGDFVERWNDVRFLGQGERRHDPRAQSRSGARCSRSRPGCSARSPSCRASRRRRASSAARSTVWPHSARSCWPPPTRSASTSKTEVNQLDELSDAEEAALEGLIRAEAGRGRAAPRGGRAARARSSPAWRSAPERRARPAQLAGVRPDHVAVRLADAPGHHHMILHAGIDIGVPSGTTGRRGRRRDDHPGLVPGRLRQHDRHRPPRRACRRSTATSRRSSWRSARRSSAARRSAPPARPATRPARTSTSRSCGTATPSTRCPTCAERRDRPRAGPTDGPRLRADG